MVAAGVRGAHCSDGVSNFQVPERCTCTRKKPSYHYLNESLGFLVRLRLSSSFRFLSFLLPLALLGFLSFLLLSGVRDSFLWCC